MSTKDNYDIYVGGKSGIFKGSYKYLILTLCLL